MKYYQYKFNKYQNKINTKIYGGSRLSKIYILVSSEFKETGQKLGKLGDLSEEVGKYLAFIDQKLLDSVDTLPHIVISDEKPKFDSSLPGEEKKRIVEQIIQKGKEEKKMMIDVQDFQEKDVILKSNIDTLYYNDHIIRGSEFRAIILNHHFIHTPHLHIAYTVLKYDIIKKKIYLDLFVTTTQFSKKGTTRKKDYIPKMFDVNNPDNQIDYPNVIFRIIRNDIENIHLMIRKIKKLNEIMYTESREHVDYKIDKIYIKLQKNIIQYLNNETIINDVQRKNIMCQPRDVITNDHYKTIIETAKEIIGRKEILKSKGYTVIATSRNLIAQGIFFEKEGEENKHAEALLINKYHKDDDMMNSFRTTDPIFVIRLYQNGHIGCGLPCQGCVRVLHGNGINSVVYSINHEQCKILNMDEYSYTYTTTGNKLLNIDTYLYGDYSILKRAEDE